MHGCSMHELMKLSG